MLPNIKIVIGGILLAVTLVAAMGAGVVVPQTYTRIGEMPEVGRPMMQQAITDLPAPAQFHILTLSRRADELSRLRDQTVQAMLAEPVVAPAPDGAMTPLPTATDRHDDMPAPIPAAVEVPAGPSQGVVAPSGGSAEVPPAADTDASTGPESQAATPDSRAPPRDSTALSAPPRQEAPARAGDEGESSQPRNNVAPVVAALPEPQADATSRSGVAPPPGLKLPRSRPNAGSTTARRAPRAGHVTRRIARLPPPPVDPGINLFGTPPPPPR